MKTLKVLGAVALLSSALAMNGVTYANERNTGRGTGPIVFVTSQGLYYDSIVVADPLPQKGDFQQLVPDENGLSTEFGPGDVGHLGGRWWIDLNEDGEMDADDKYFLCPLLGPGREHLWIRNLPRNQSRAGEITRSPRLVDLKGTSINSG